MLYRQLPKIKKYLAYLPEGPVIDWTAPDIGEWLRPLADHVRSAGAFGVRIGATAVARRWNAETIKAAIADERVTRLSEAIPDQVNHETTRTRNRLRELGWRPPEDEDGFAAGQPRFVFQLPIAGRSPDQLLAGMNQLWRRNIKKAAKAGVVVQRGTLMICPSSISSTSRPPSVIISGPDRCRTSRPCSTRFWPKIPTESGCTWPTTKATWSLRPRGCEWASTPGTPGASSTAKRDVRGSNAVQWKMITDALEAGATIYDLRGITEGLEEDDPHLGLIQFKVGTGGEAVEYLGEWDLP